MKIGYILSAITVLALAYNYLYKGKKPTEIFRACGLILLACLMLPSLVDFIDAIVGNTTAIFPNLKSVGDQLTLVFPATCAYVWLKNSKSSAWINFFADLLFWTLISTVVGIYILGSGQSITLLILVNIAIFVGAFITLVRISGSWGVNGRITYGVAITYVMVVVITSIMAYILGYRQGFILVESAPFLVLMACLQVILLWLSCGIDPQEKNMRKRWSYWLVKTWMVGCMFTLIYLLTPIFNGEISAEDFFVNGDKNFGKIASYQLRKDELMTNYDGIKGKIREAYKDGNLKKVEELTALAIKKEVELGKLKTKYLPTNDVPAEYDDGSGFIQTAVTKSIGVIKGGSDIYEKGKATFKSYFPGKQDGPPETDNKTYTFEGAGYTGGEFGTGGFKTLQFNVDVKNGDSVYIEGRGAQIYSGGTYRSVKRETIHMNGGWVWIRAPQKEIVTLKVVSS